MIACENCGAETIHLENVNTWTPLVTQGMSDPEPRVVLACAPCGLRAVRTAQTEK